MKNVTNLESHGDTHVFSVTQLSFLIKGTLEDGFPEVWIEGEVSAPKKHTSGHLYFSLKDDGGCIDAVCWKGLTSRVLPVITHGQRAICFGKVSSFPGRSKYQLIVQKAHATGQGSLHLMLEKRKNLLKAEGLFDSEKKRAIPKFPRAIGVITSESGAVIQDILHRIAERYPCPVFLFPAAVQGAESLHSLLDAFQNAACLADKKNIDVLIVARGGGSLEDLFVFNEEPIVRAVAAFPVPVISAIGHETDITLCDFAADKRAPTPTAAAEIATPEKALLRASVFKSRSTIFQNVLHILQNKKNESDILSARQAHLKTNFDLWGQRLDFISSTLFENPLGILEKERKFFEVTSSLKSPKNYIELYRSRLSSQKDRIQNNCSAHLKERFVRHGALCQSLHDLSYKNTLNRGFCMATNPDGTVLSHAKSTAKSPNITLNFQDGVVHVQTKHTKT